MINDAKKLACRSLCLQKNFNINFLSQKPYLNVIASRGRTNLFFYFFLLKNFSEYKSIQCYTIAIVGKYIIFRIPNSIVVKESSYYYYYYWLVSWYT